MSEQTKPTAEILGWRCGNEFCGALNDGLSGPRCWRCDTWIIRDDRLAVVALTKPATSEGIELDDDGLPIAVGAALDIAANAATTPEDGDTIGSAEECVRALVAENAALRSQLVRPTPVAVRYRRVPSGKWIYEDVHAPLDMAAWEASIRSILPEDSGEVEWLYGASLTSEPEKP